MKKLYAFTAFFIGLISTAQIVSIPDANFKAKLLQASPTNPIASAEEYISYPAVNTFVSIDTNSDGEIQLSEALAIKFLNINASNISNLEGISSFSNLTDLYCGENHLTSLSLNASQNLKGLGCYDNQLTTLDLTIFPNLKGIDCRFNQLTTLNVNGLIHLEGIVCSSNQLTSLDISNLPSFLDLDCSDNLLTSLNTNGSVNITNIRVDDNPFTELDFSQLIHLNQLDFANNTQLVYVNAKNGSNDEIEFENCPNLRYICVDEPLVAVVQAYLQLQGIEFCQVNTYCSFTPGGNFYTVQGNTHVDYDNNGCDNDDLNYPNLNFIFSNGTASGNIIANSSGQFTLNFISGTYTITPVLENPEYYSISPTNIEVTFPDQVSPLTQNFCITPIGTHQDVEIMIFPLTPARPGFDARYKIIYKNKGNVPSTGSISFTFEDDRIDFVSATPAPTTQNFGVLSWDYANSLPYEIREIITTLNVNSPLETPAVNIGDKLGFTASINPSTVDENTMDNYSGLRQTVVGSFDPNDKTCVEGDIIGPEMIGEYVHYVIRFENTGTYAAENIVVKDIIDTTKFDISTLIPLNGSHNYTTKIMNTNQVEFIFENINLPFDDANNDGYVTFKIKTKPTLVVGDTFSNTADIYFDYNFPIVTNTATTTITALGTQDFEFSNIFTLSPVPAKNSLTITTKQDIMISSVNIYNTLGQLVQVITNPNETIDVSGLKTGSYFIKIISDKGTASSKFIKE
ncbi:DUF7619 domain-containing protein [Flavobacterium sangjuense]|uniref:Uncharacterized protein n=1 Tax=Flavobacterium sangjuense TaxID=2518177 RepID=A0A4P7PUK7_9FLAO|nr:T9SS type A sorting domain-containing protein [Flavobacterium sangjuense]QBZ98629.1 hypothetical protein GS03_02138 [Flavobacterium sangjuense]